MMTRFISRSLLAIAACAGATSMVMGADSVVIDASARPVTFESDPANYAEFVISRSGTSQLTVNMLLLQAFKPAKPGLATDPTADYKMEFFDVIGQPLTNGSTYDPLTGAVTLIIPASQSLARVRITPVNTTYPSFDGDVYSAATGTPELREYVTLQVLYDNTGNGPYIVTGDQTTQVKIVDGNVTARNLVLRNTATELQQPVVGSELAPAGTGNIRVWFQNSEDARGTAYHSSFAPYCHEGVNGDFSLAGRLVELTLLSGNDQAKSSRYIMTYHIGGGVASEGNGEAVTQPYAYRLVTESKEKILAYPDTTADNYYRYNDGAGRIHQIAGSLAKTNGVVFLYVDGWAIPNGAQNFRVSVGAISAAPCTVDGNRITLATPAQADILQGAPVTLDFVVPTPTSGTPPTILNVPDQRRAKIDEPVLYPVGSVTIAVGGSLSLHVGDCFAFSSDPLQFYRVVGPTPSVSLTHPSKTTAVNRDAYFPAVPASVSPAGTLTPGEGANLPLKPFIAIWPPLVKPLLRADAPTIITSFTPTFSGTGNREVITIPGLPNYDSLLWKGPPNLRGSFPLVTQMWPDGSWVSGGKSDDLPKGDWVDFTISPIDDTIVQGAEKVTLVLNTSNANNGYDVRDPAVASVIIRDNDSIADITTVNSAAEPNRNGKFRVTFTAPFPKDIQVRYQMTTTGLSLDPTYLANWVDNYPVNGQPTDFQLDGLNPSTGIGTLTLKAGLTSIDIVCQPLPDAIVENTEQLKIQLMDSDDYVLRSTVSGNLNASAASMEILDPIAIASISLDPTSLKEVYEGETDVTKFPKFTVSLARRTGYSGAAMVPLTISGTAFNGIDYSTLPASLSFTALEFAKSVTLTPIVDSITEPDETSIITIADGSNYIVDVLKSSATATIKDGKPPVIGTTTGATTAGTATAGTATAGTTAGTVTSGTTTGSASGDVQQNSGCGAGTGLAFLSGLLVLIGFRRRLR